MMVSMRLFPPPIFGTIKNAIKKSCLALPDSARLCQLKIKKAPENQGLGWLNCRVSRYPAKREIIPTQWSPAACR